MLGQVFQHHLSIVQILFGIKETERAMDPDPLSSKAVYAPDPGED